MYEAELHRLKGELLLSPGRPCEDAAEAALHRAIAVAREQGATNVGAARGRQPRPAVARQGKRAEAHDLLAPVYGWFTEGFDTPDLKDAKALLDALT